jgi:hypothetical protein
MDTFTDILKTVFGVIIAPRTYASIGYTLLALPLGTAYFVVLVTGFSVGVGTLVIWVGVPILLLTLAVAWAMATFERRLTSLMLEEEIGPMSSGTPVATDGSWRGRWQTLRAHLGNPVTWTSMFYLFVKFPIGVFTFTVTVTLLATSIGLILAPLFYRISDPLVFTWWDGRVFTFWPIDSMGETWLVTLAGVAVLFVSLHLINGMAKWSGQLAKATLGRE